MSKPKLNLCVIVIISLAVIAGVVSLLIKPKEKFSSMISNNSEYPNYYVYKKDEKPFSDRSKGVATPNLPAKDSALRIDKEPFSSCTDYCH
jgi:hypothetical protein